MRALSSKFLVIYKAVLNSALENVDLSNKVLAHEMWFHLIDTSNGDS